MAKANQRTKTKKLELTDFEHTFLESIGNGSYVFTFYPDRIDDPTLSFNNEKIMRACTALVLYSDTNDIELVTKTLGISKRTFYNYLKTYREDKNFMKKRPVTNVSSLQLYLDEITESLKKHRVKTYVEAQMRIKEITGISMKYDRVRIFLLNNYFKKDSRGYFYRSTSKEAKIQIAVRNKKAQNKNFLESNKKEIESYANSIASSCNYNGEKIAKKIQEKYNLIESEEKIGEWINKYTSFEYKKSR